MDKTTKYYDENYADYVDGWSPEHLHYGFWFENTKTHEESLCNHTKEILKYLNLHTGNQVLDAGCGTGGSCRYIVEHFDVNVVGIMLSPTLFESAKTLSININNKDRLSFYHEDFTNTQFKNETFDRIFSIESVCHAAEKYRFINEAFRLLKKGGKLVVSDFYLLKIEMNKNENRSYREWCDGWAIPELANIDDFNTMLADAGFHSIEFHDKTMLIRKSGQLMYDGAKERLPMIFSQNIEGKIPKSRLGHVIATYRQWECIEWGIWCLGMYVAEKKK